MTLTVSEARAALPELLNRVADGEEITITRHGQPVAVMIRPEALRSRRADQALRAAEQIHSLLAGGQATAVSGSAGLSAERAEELIADIRAGRRAS